MSLEDILERITERYAPHVLDEDRIIEMRRVAEAAIARGELVKRAPSLTSADTLIRRMHYRTEYVCKKLPMDIEAKAAEAIENKQRASTAWTPEKRKAHAEKQRRNWTPEARRLHGERMAQALLEARIAKRERANAEQATLNT